jgi:hypothetical protein
MRAVRDYLRTYARNGDDFYRLKQPYRAWVTVALWIGLALTLVFLWAVGGALGARLGLDFHAAITLDVRTVAFVAVMALMAPSSMLVICTGVVWAGTVVFRAKGWMSRSEAIRLVIHSEYPRHWIASIPLRMPR